MLGQVTIVKTNTETDDSKMKKSVDLNTGETPGVLDFNTRNHSVRGFYHFTVPVKLMKCVYSYLPSLCGVINGVYLPFLRA